MSNQRRNIINHILTNLKLIDGSISSLNSNYTFQNNAFNNVFRKVKFLDEVNDFPSIFFQVGEEVRVYNTSGNTTGLIPLTLRIYVNDEESSGSLDSLIQDIEHVIYNLDTGVHNIRDMTISSVDTDEGLVKPYGIGEIEILIEYELDIEN
tara:strand:+ start:629 stop:1081 length:453 start_codon:yes stop_codon:yes gene_type:complete